MNKDITIIFVIYKSGNILFENLKSLKNFPIIVIDNDPKSLIQSYLSSLDNNITYFKMFSNIGMAKAANHAFEKVQTNFFLYLTADTLIKENDILNLLKIYKKYDNVGLSCPIHLDKKNNYKGNYFCNPVKRIIKRNQFQKRLYKSLSKILPSGDFSVDTVWGAPILLKKSIIKKIGFFDENFFMFFEDVDLCDRLKKNNFEIIETPTAICHHHQDTTFPKSIKHLYITITSYKFSELYYFSKHNYRHVLRVYIHSFDYFFRFILNIFLFNKKKILTNLFRLIGIIRYIFYKKTKS